MAPKPRSLNPLVEQGDRPVSVARDILAHVNDSTLAPQPLRAALALADAAPLALLALGIPLCPSCELLTASLNEIGRARPGLDIHVAALSSAQEWADRERLLWPRGIHVGRASVPVLVLLRNGQVLAIRHGGGPASVIDSWLSEVLGPPAVPIAGGMTDAEGERLDAIADLRRRRLATRYRSVVG